MGNRSLKGVSCSTGKESAIAVGLAAAFEATLTADPTQSPDILNA